jgi:hypothetical protein
MKPDITNTLCYVCGYPDMPSPAFRQAGSQWDFTYVICPCCGFEYGIDGWSDELNNWDPKAYEKFLVSGLATE